jgi:pyruvate dehydrogenase E2 component (dihydrolipoamide acetyltransferase)
MPTLGLDMEEATIQAWLKREGEAVRKDEPLLVVETDKASVEISAPETGILRQVLHPEGATVPVTHTIAIIETGEQAEASEDSVACRAVQVVTPERRESRPGEFGPAANQAESLELRASPAARRLARELGVPLQTVKGTGPQGRIQGEDVRRVAAAATAVGSQPASPPPPSRVPEGLPQQTDSIVAGLPGHFLPLSRKRRLTAERMAQSSRTVPRITLNVDIDATEAVRMRSERLPTFKAEHGVRLSYDDFLVAAVAAALRDHPHMNARWTEQGVYLVEPINVGVAVAAEDGLVVPVIRHADRKTLAEISVELNRLTAKAREDRLTLDDVTDGTFTITNLGMFGIDSFAPLVNPPETAILGVGRIAERPAGRGGQIVLRPSMTLSLSADHRAVDGAPAARFLQRVKQLLEEPHLLP